jgi:hypothetical protein
MFFLNVKKGPIQGSIYFKLVPRFLIPISLSKMALKHVDDDYTRVVKGIVKVDQG